MVIRTCIARVAVGGLTVAALVGVGVAPARAQMAGVQLGAGASAEADPMQCWWRTTTTAVRVGEPFGVVLTCSVLETDSVTVVPDQSNLDPTVMQLAPFEVLSGTHAADLRTDDHRFFQYEYRVRLINDTLFGKEAKLPATRISYRLQSRVGQGAAVEGRESVYQLPAQAIRILSIVPSDAADIRDATAETFANGDARAFRASTLFFVGGLLFVLAGLVTLVALARLFRHYRAKAPETTRLVADAAILGNVQRELSVIAKERESAGWTPDLAERALAALRIAASYALSRPASQIAVDEDSEGNVGALLMRGRAGRMGGKRVLVSGSATAHSVGRELALMTTNGRKSVAKAQRLEELQRALVELTQFQYGRANGSEATLDASLATGQDVVRRLKQEYGWLALKVSAMTDRAGVLGRRVWAR